ncbi:hypothetical protein AOLI_G00327190 [Acnodon oligacanthus]
MALRLTGVVVGFRNHTIRAVHTCSILSCPSERHGPDYDARSVPYWSVVELMGAWDMAGLSRARQIVYQTSAGTVRVLV